jgi:putative membrane protein
MRFVLRLLINAAALWAATRIVPGVTHSGTEASLFAVALVFGLLNALLRPLLTILSCPLLILTLGLFTFVINGLILWLTSAVSGRPAACSHQETVLPRRRPPRRGLGFHVGTVLNLVISAAVRSPIVVRSGLSASARPPGQDYQAPSVSPSE